MRFLVLFLLTFALPVGYGAEVYKEIGEDGVPSFSDQKSEGAETIQIQEPMTFETPANVRTLGDSYENSAPPAHHVPRDYKLMITDPPDDSSVRENSGQLTLSITIEPALHESHTAELIMDGEAIRTLQGSGGVTLSNVDRGTHRFNVQVVDPEGTLVDHGPAISIHMQRFAQQRGG